MKSDITPPPCSGADIRLSATAADKLLSEVTPADSDIVGLGISFDLEPLPAISTKCIDARPLRNSKSKAHTAEAFNTLVSTSKSSSGAATPLQDNRKKVAIAGTGPPRWLSGVPGLGNTILGPRCPRVSISISPPMTSLCNAPKYDTSASFSAHATSYSDVPLAPSSRKPSRAKRTSTKRRATSPPSTGKSAKMAKVSVDSSVVKHDQTPVPPSETEKRAKAARLWQVEQEKIKQQMEKTIDRGGVKPLPDEMRDCISKEQSVQRERQPLHTDTVLEGCAVFKPLSPEPQKMIERACDTINHALHLPLEQNNEYGGSCKGHQTPKHSGQRHRAQRRIAKLHEADSYKQITQPRSPEVQTMIEYACDATSKPTQLSVEQNYEHKDHNTNLLGQGDRSGRKIAKLDQAGSYKQLSQSPHPSTTNTCFRGHTLPSAIKKATPTSTSSNDKKRVSFADETNLDHLTTSFLALVEPYTHLHASCPAVRPLQLIHSSLSSLSATGTALCKALKDAQELLKVLNNHQAVTLAKLERIKEEMEKVGMGSVVKEARRRVERTEEDAKKIESWMREVKCSDGEV